MTKYSDAFIHDMPKSDLHLHLDGSLRIPTLIEMAKKNNIKMPSYTEEGLRELVFKSAYSNLGEYLHGFQYTCAALRDLENIERVAYELAIDNQNENVYYIEPRFAPQLMMDVEAGLTMETVMEAAYKGLDRAKKEHNNRSDVKSGTRPEFHYGIISCAMRNFGPKGYSPYYTGFYKTMEYSKHIEIVKAAALQMVRAAVKIRDEKAIPIVSIDLAGQEEGYPCGKFHDVYAYAHKTSCIKLSTPVRHTAPKVFSKRSQNATQIELVTVIICLMKTKLWTQKLSIRKNTSVIWFLLSRINERRLRSA